MPASGSFTGSPILRPRGSVRRKMKRNKLMIAPYTPRRKFGRENEHRNLKKFPEEGKFKLVE